MEVKASMAHLGMKQFAFPATNCAACGRNKNCRAVSNGEVDLEPPAGDPGVEASWNQSLEQVLRVTSLQRQKFQTPQHLYFSRLSWV